MKILLLTLAAIVLCTITILGVIVFLGVFFPLNWVLPLTLVYLIATAMVVSQI